MATASGAKLFGTDGVRGVAGEFLSGELAFALGRAATSVCEPDSPQVLVVRDTRVSGEMLESALCAGIAAAGGQALLGGVVPTPAAPQLVRRLGLDLAAVISASHNPHQYNGIKFFDSEGYKLSDEAESSVEQHVSLGRAKLAGEASQARGRVRPLAGALEDYLRALHARFQTPLDGMRVLLDCANGATYRAAPLMLERLGAQVDTVACEPDGTNINHGCGSTHVELLAELMRQGEHDIGFAFDGDGDRVLAVDRDGRVADGDEIIAHAALHLRSKRELAGDGVVVTVMSNYGFHRAMQAAGIEVATTDVGDRHVVTELLERGWVLGGEQSGHVINLRFVPSGDGVAAALLLLEALGGARLADSRVMEKLPQRLVSMPVADRDALQEASAVWQAVDAESLALEGRGRVLVRPSGTEPVVRVMVEAPTPAECKAVSERLAQMVEAELGAPPTSV